LKFQYQAQANHFRFEKIHMEIDVIIWARVSTLSVFSRLLNLHYQGHLTLLNINAEFCII